MDNQPTDSPAFPLAPKIQIVVINFFFQEEIRSAVVLKITFCWSCFLKKGRSLKKILSLLENRSQLKRDSVKKLFYSKDTLQVLCLCKSVMTAHLIMCRITSKMYNIML